MTSEDVCLWFHFFVTDKHIKAGLDYGVEKFAEHVKNPKPIPIELEMDSDKDKFCFLFGY